MKPDYSYLLFSIGPVQDFIAASRKTLDLFAGSLLLSDLIGAAIGVVLDNKGKMIFPDVNDKDELVIGDIASLPNRFFCKVPSNIAKDIAENAANAVQNKFDKISSKVRIGFGINSDIVWDNFWNEQIKNFLEVYWVLLENEDSMEYPDKYRSLEQFLGKRKLMRDFRQLEQQGIKCSLILNFSAIHPNGVDAKKFWEEQAKRNKKYFRSGERLSSVAVTKRKFLNALGQSDSFPSTSTIAAAGFLRTLIKQVMTDTDLKTSVGDYAKKVQMMQETLNGQREIKNITSLYGLADDDELLKKLLQIDGDWLFNESYNEKGIKKEYGLEGELPNVVTVAKESFDDLFRKVSEYNDRQTDKHKLIKSPSKYYAVFYFDGDKMGENLSKAKNEESHKKISKALRTFSIETIPAIVEGSERLGKIIYSGGDDVLCFCALDDMFDIVLDIRKKFSEAMRSAGIENATGSIGIAIAHHQMNLQQVLEAARNAEHYAKEKAGRDAVGFALLRNSGEHSTIGAKWFPNENSTIDVLKSFSKKIDDKIISTSFVYDLESERIGMEKNEGAMIKSEIKRLLNRRTIPKKRKMLIETEIKIEPNSNGQAEVEIDNNWHNEIVTFFNSLKISRLNDENKLDVSVLKQFIDLLEVAQFTARGGLK